MRYGDYSSLGPILERYIKSKDTILQIGCGNSVLAEQLYDNGYRNVTSKLVFVLNLKQHRLGIDTDAKVIQKQQAKNGDSRPELNFKNVSATEVCKNPISTYIFCFRPDLPMKA